jgi:hypothetical protein
MALDSKNTLFRSKKKFRNLIFILLILLASAYGYYFVKYHALMSLVADSQAAAIEEIIRHSLSSQTQPGITPHQQKRADTPNSEGGLNTGANTYGCSFLLMEMLYRDCITVSIGKKDSRSALPINHDSLRRQIEPIVQSPCSHLHLVGAGTAYALDAYMQCKKTRRSYLATVIYNAADGESITLFKTYGEFK